MVWPRQVAYVTYDQHLIYVEPKGSVVKPPGEPLEVDTDSANYRCLIKALTMEAVWWETWLRRRKGRRLRSRSGLY